MSPSDGSGHAPEERYERGERIATGGMGEVWRARDTVLGREVAVKVLKREYADDPTFRARFEAEARHAAGLHHPGIASVFDYGLLPDDETPYLVMELVDGKPLSDLVAEGQPFDPEQARLLGLQVAEALGVAHAAGVVHRDVKPGNLLVLPDGRVKITDFGIARAAGSVAMTQTGQIVGTPHYISPEQAQGEPATAASDVYALGVVLFECLAGHRPFEGDSPITTALAHIRQDVPDLPESVPQPLAAVVRRAMAKAPADRFADGGELATALRQAGQGIAPAETQVLTGVAAAGAAGAAATSVEADPTPTPASTPVPPAEPEPRAARRSRGPLIAVLLLALIVIGALLVAQPWSQDSETTGDQSAETVRVRPKAYIGKPVEEVEDALRAKGLKTRTEAKDNPGDQEAGTVASLDPTGNVEKGETITLEVWGDPPAAQPSEDTDNSDQGNQDKGNPSKGNPGNEGGGNQGGGNQGNDNQTQQPDPEESTDPDVDPGVPGDEESQDPGAVEQPGPGTSDGGGAGGRTTGPGTGNGSTKGPGKGTGSGTGKGQKGAGVVDE